MMVCIHPCRALLILQGVSFHLSMRWVESNVWSRYLSLKEHKRGETLVDSFQEPTLYILNLVATLLLSRDTLCKRQKEPGTVLFFQSQTRVRGMTFSCPV